VREVAQVVANQLTPSQFPLASVTAFLCGRHRRSRNAQQVRIGPAQV